MPPRRTTPSAPAPVAGQAPAFLNNVERQGPSADRLEAIQAKLREARDKKQEHADLEARAAECKKQLDALLNETLPDMLSAVSMDKIGLQAEGNNPAYDCKIEPLIRANIAAGWEPALRAKGFATLEKIGGEGLIKTTVTFQFDAKDRASAKEFVENVFDEFGYEGTEALSVNHNTLASFLKAEVQADPPRVPTPEQLADIGGFVGRTLKMKERKA